MGALEYVPSKQADFDVSTKGIDYDTIARECEKLLSAKPANQLDLLYQMGGSSGGTRPKILIHEDGRDWIIKFPSKNDPFDSGKREFDYSLCAKDCHITMTETELIPSSLCEGYFKTERFDRKQGERIFCVTFAGLLETDFRVPSCDYKTYLRLARMLTKDRKYDKEQLFRVMCFNIITHNLDDHAKNFSFTFTENQGWRLAPAYDLTYSDTYWGEHTTSVNGKGKDITDDDLLAIGLEAGLSKDFCNRCIKEIREKSASLEKYIHHPSSDKGTTLSFSERLRELQAPSA